MMSCPAWTPVSEPPAGLEMTCTGAALATDAAARNTAPASAETTLKATKAPEN
jgi:hypothetical protein